MMRRRVFASFQVPLVIVAAWVMWEAISRTDAAMPTPLGIGCGWKLKPAQ